jgi:hypothetical protein
MAAPPGSGDYAQGLVELLTKLVPAESVTAPIPGGSTEAGKAQPVASPP